MYFSDLQWCGMASHELGCHPKENCVCNNYRITIIYEINDPSAKYVNFEEKF